MTHTPPTAEHEMHPDLMVPTIAPDEYLETVFSLYRQDHADYRGRRNEDQQVIAELASEEADEYFDQNMLAVMALRSLMMPGARVEPFIPPDDAEEAQITVGNLADGASLKDMRNSWRQLWVGMNIMTNRLHRDHAEFGEAGMIEIFDMKAADKQALISHLFGNFQDLNGLSFGAQGSGVRRTVWANDPDTMEPVRTKVDADKARTPKTFAGNAARRRFGARVQDTKQMHAAGKMTPEEFKALRREFPEVDMDNFVRDTSYYKDVRARYEGQLDQDQTE